MSGKPAILGGSPAFDRRLNIVNPVLPSLKELEGDIDGILTSGMVTKGQHLRRLEEEMAEHLQVEHVVAVSSCTSGLILSCRGLGLTGDIVVPSFTFMATVSAAVWAGLNPVFADVDSGTTNLDPAAVEAAITPNTSAIMAVHNFGNPAEIEELQAIADRHGLKVIYDAAHGFGSLYKGKPIGGFGDAEAFSMSPTKLVIAGEGGIVSTNDAQLADNVRLGREYGMKDYNTVFPGINSRLPEFNALLAGWSLGNVEEAALVRNQAAAAYRERLSSVPGISFQDVAPEHRCSWKDFSIVISEPEFGLSRDRLAEAMAAENIDVRKYYDPPVHRHTAYQNLLVDASQLTATEYLSANCLSLPIWSCKDDGAFGKVADAIERISSHSKVIRHESAA